MGTVIEGISAVHAGHGPFHRGGLALADRAGRRCLEGAGRSASDLDLLINVGTYHDRSLGEPALASMIQQDLHVPGHPVEGLHGTFSFDVSAGGCGMLTAAHLVDGFVRSATARTALIVASDAEPDPLEVEGYPYGRTGGALLLSAGDDEAGFVAFHFGTFPEHVDLYESRIVWHPAPEGRPHLRPGHNVLTIRIDPTFEDRCVECAGATVAIFLQERGLRARDMDLLVASTWPSGFAERLGRAMELPDDRVARPDPSMAGAHTAGPAAALAPALESGQLDRAHEVLFVAVGAGIGVAVALYHP